MKCVVNSHESRYKTSKNTPCELIKTHKDDKLRSVLLWYLPAHVGFLFSCIQAAKLEHSIMLSVFKQLTETKDTMIVEFVPSLPDL